MLTMTMWYGQQNQTKELFSDTAIGAFRCDRMQYPDKTVTEGSYRYHKADYPTVCQTHRLRLILHSSFFIIHSLLLPPPPPPHDKKCPPGHSLSLYGHPPPPVGSTEGSGRGSVLWKENQCGTRRTQTSRAVSRPPTPTAVSQLPMRWSLTGGPEPERSRELAP